MADEVKIRDYHPDDFESVRRIYFDGCYEMFWKLVWLMLHGSKYPSTSQIHSIIIALSLILMFCGSGMAGKYFERDLAKFGALKKPQLKKSYEKVLNLKIELEWPLQPAACVGH